MWSYLKWYYTYKDDNVLSGWRKDLKSWWYLTSHIKVCCVNTIWQVVTEIICWNCLPLKIFNFPLKKERGFPSETGALNFWHTYNMHSFYRCFRHLTAVSKHNLCFLSSPGCVRNTVHARDYTSEGGQVYGDAFSRSVNNPAEFWAEASEDIVWHKKWTKVLDDSSSPFTKW